jgi:hypothetical protein
MMGTLADLYRLKGDEATLAEMEADHPLTRHILSKVAAHWHELADRVERQEAAADSVGELPGDGLRLVAPVIPVPAHVVER